MDMNAETKLDLRNEDLKELQELGQGQRGEREEGGACANGPNYGEKGVFLAFDSGLRRSLRLSSQWLS